MSTAPPPAFPPETPFFLPPTDVNIPPRLSVPPIGLPPVGIPGGPPPTGDDDDDGDDIENPPPTDPPTDPPTEPPVDVPEPGTMTILLIGVLLTFAAFRLRRQAS